MKRLTGILLALIFCFSIFMNSVADENASPGKITINGVNVVFTEGKTVLEPIENDGVIYVPLEAFLKMLDIDYKVSGNVFAISTDFTEEKATDTPKPTATPKPASEYSKLSPAEKKFLDTLIKEIDLFYNPGTLTILEAWETKSSTETDILDDYYVDVNEQIPNGGIGKVRYYP